MVPFPGPPRVLNGFVWHHTDANALISIVKRKWLWVSSFRSMNDSSEAIHGEEVLREGFAEFSQSNELHPVLAQALQLVEYWGIRGQLRGQAFLLSATGVFDSLNQWQHYSHQQGYALGFEIGYGLKTAPDQASLGGDADPTGGPAWLEVMYDRDEQRQLVIDILGDANEQAQKVDTTSAEDENGLSLMQRLANYNGSLLFPLIQCVASFKHSAFAPEREFRWVASGSTGGVDFRSSARGIVPYITRYFDVGSSKVGATRLAAVMCGPGSQRDQDEDILNVTQLLEAYGMAAEVQVLRSGVPYRF